jgi:hypothetical protein
MSCSVDKWARLTIVDSRGVDILGLGEVVMRWALLFLAVTVEERGN